MSKVMLFSGGLDSVLQEHFIKPDKLLYIDIGGEYSKAEIKHIKTLGAHYTRRLVIQKLDISAFEASDLYLPFRNLLFITLAFEYGDQVYIGFNEADNAPDKDAAFMLYVNDLFRHMNKPGYVPSSWKGTPLVQAPFKTFTKTELLRKYINEGGYMPLIKKLRTCYDAESKKGCGKCSPCLSKAVALINNGQRIQYLFDEPITKAALIKMRKVHLKYRKTSRQNAEFTNAIALL